MKITSKRGGSGFTLIEALITISIVSILASIAIPSFTKMVESNRISAASNEFLSALMYARSEAAKRSFTVAVCASNDGKRCTNGLTDYAKGWIVFVDCTDNKVMQYNNHCDLDGDGNKDDSDVLLRVQQEIKNVSIISQSTTTGSYFSYRFSGRPLTAAGFNIGPAGEDATKKINVARTGRVRMEDI